LVIAHNPDKAPLAKPQLSFLASTGLTPKIVREPSPDASGDLFWEVELTGGESLPASTKFVVQLTYPVNTRPVIATGVVTVISAAPQSAVSSLKVALSPPEGSADEFKNFDLLLQIENGGRRTVELQTQSLEVLNPSRKYVELTTPELAMTTGGVKHNAIGGRSRFPFASPRTISPGASATVPVTIESKVAIPGTYPLVLSFQARLQDSQAGWEKVTTQSKITLGIPGLSEAMQFLGIPSLLLLPGALMILTFLSVLPMLTGWPEIDWKKPGLLIAAIILSAIAAMVYPWLTGLIGTERNYLRGYSLRDIIYVWLGSIVAGLIPALVVSYLKYRRDRAEVARDALYYPLTSDGPLDILTKLVRNGASFKLRRAPAPDLWLILPFARSNEEWLVKQAIVEPASADNQALERGGKVEQALEAIEKDNSNAIEELIELIKAGIDEKLLRIRWAGGQGPQQSNVRLADTGQEVKFIRYEP
jgi:hypothetical protein